MSNSISSPSYTIKLFENSTSEDFIEALNIYLDEMPSELRTASNEIIYWIDNYNGLFDDKLLVFGFYENENLIGFAQCLYFVKEYFITIDYFVISANYRGNHSFQMIIALLKEFLKKYKFEYNFIVTEIDLENKSLMQLLKTNGFGEIQSQYFQPSLGINNYDSLIEAKLLYFPAYEDKVIKKETYKMIIETLYYKHYLRWYSAFLVDKDLESYKSMIEDNKTKIFKNLDDKINVIGGKKPMNEYKEFNVKHNIKNTTTILGVILIFLGANLFLGKFFDMPYTQMIPYMLFNTLIFVAIYIFVSNKDKAIEIFQLLLKLFDKVK